MFNPNDLDYIMTADDVRAEEERDAELEAQYADAVARYEMTYVETPHCTAECSEYGAVSHSATCREAQAIAARNAHVHPAFAPALTAAVTIHGGELAAALRAAQKPNAPYHIPIGNTGLLVTNRYTRRNRRIRRAA